MTLCPYDDSYGIFDFSCKRCIARLYVQGTEREQAITRAKWRATLTAAEIEEMKELVARERARGG